MEKLAISKNGRYLIRPDGTPFPWIADTGWTVPSRLKWDDVLHYLKVRKQEGFTVLQMVVLDPEFNPEMQNPCGIKALRNGKLDQRNEEYFTYVDWVLDEAEKLGFYILLLPVWGQLVVGEDWSGNTYEKTVREDNAFEYGRWLGKREAARPNVLWCLGGDRMPVHNGTDYRKVWRELAEGLAFGLTGKKLSWNQNHEEWKKLMLTYHPCHERETGECSTFSYWTDEEAWISFIMLQSGHGITPKNYELIQKEYERTNAMPVWDGEPAYEAMPTEWPITPETKFHGPDIVRKRAYGSIFAGAFGYTYGHASVWCTVSEKERNELARYTWTEALMSEGAHQMKILRDFLETFPAESYYPCQKALIEQSRNPDRLADHRQACISRDRRILLVYFYRKVIESLDLQQLLEQRGPQESIRYAWFNPADGTVSRTQTITDENLSGGIWKVHFPEDADDGDRVLIIAVTDAEEEKRNTGITVVSGSYYQISRNENQRKVFDW